MPTPDFLLYHVLINALLILFVYGITSEDMPFHFIRRALDKVLMKDGEARLIYYPILYCPYCMPSLWGLGYFLTVLYTPPFSVDQVGYLAVHIACLWALVKFMYDTQNA